ncbi:MAG: hypothetical protein AABW47_03665 [Nanoarchaeota archaeon]
MGELNPAFKNSKLTLDLETAKRYYLSESPQHSLIISPTLIGVYRRFVPTEYLGDPIFCKNPSLITCGFDLDNVPEVHPQLVQIGFDPSMLERGVIQDYLGSESERMLIVPYTNLKPSGETLQRFSSLASKFSDLVSNTHKIEDSDKEAYISLIKELSRTEGLTEREYELFRKNSSLLGFTPKDLLLSLLQTHL